jgi:hypothetical protein
MSTQMPRNGTIATQPRNQRLFGGNAAQSRDADNTARISGNQPSLDDSLGSKVSDFSKLFSSMNLAFQVSAQKRQKGNA